MRSPRAVKFEFWVQLDCFSRFVKNFRNVSNPTENSNLIARGERTTLSHHFELAWAILGPKLTEIAKFLQKLRYMYIPM